MQLKGASPTATLGKRGFKGVFMCDTLVAKDSATGVWFLAKNSDRDIGEPQVIQYCDPEEGLTSPTHLEQREYYNNNQYQTLLKASKELSLTYPALISRPAWIWGAEMGINSEGVAIGNEAVFAKRGSSKGGLLGMDILRLTLHAASTARGALETIVSLLERWGQGGNGSYSGRLQYHNSFLIADGTEAYLLESVNQRWVAKQVDEVASISNAYTLEEEYTLGDSVTLKERPNFKRTYASRLHLPFTQGTHRQNSTYTLALERGASWDSMVSILRHNEGGVTNFDHSMRSVCMDAKGLVKSRTTASMVVKWTPKGAEVALTTSPIPLYAPFIPVELSDEAFTSSPFREIEYSYNFAKERMEQTERLLKAPLEKRLAVNKLVLKFEEELAGEPLEKEREFREEVAKILES